MADHLWTRMRRRGWSLQTAVFAAVVVAASLLLSTTGHSRPLERVAQAASVCADYSTQADAQSAGDTRDADGDGIFCESLPCPCSTGSGSEPEPTQDAAPTPAPQRTRQADECATPRAVQRITFSRTKYRDIWQHYVDAVQAGWPRILIVNRPFAAARRERLLRDHPVVDGSDRDEYPPAIGRGRGRHLTRGDSPKGWRADVAAVDSGENRSHGARLGIKLRRFCDGTRFRYVFY